MQDNSIIQKILGSSKYKDLNENTISNVSVTQSYNESNIRSKLHQIWGAYYSTRPNFSKLLRKLKESELSLEDITLIHSSTKERRDEYKEIFDYIFSQTGSNPSILDIGCAFNPIFFLIKDFNFSNYVAVDIDKAQQGFLNKLFEINSKENMKAIVGDALIDSFEYFDIVFAFKLLPVLDQVSKEKCNEFLRNLKCKYLAVSFPNKSLGGREKGMKSNYQELYVPRLKELGYSFKDSNSFQNESVYIFTK